MLHLAVELANDFLIKSSEKMPLYNIGSDRGKLYDLRKHSLLYQLRYTMAIVFQSFQGPITTWNPHCKTNQTKPPKTKTQQTSLWASLLCGEASATGRPQSNRLQAQKDQVIRNCELKIPSSPQNMPWISWTFCSGENRVVFLQAGLVAVYEQNQQGFTGYFSFQ